MTGPGDIVPIDPDQNPGPPLPLPTDLGKLAHDAWIAELERAAPALSVARVPWHELAPAVRKAWAMAALAILRAID